MDNRGAATVEALIAKGVEIPNPSTVDITDDVDPDLISAEGVVIHPGCRIRGSRTVISSGSILGAETPMTIENCRLGRNVELKGGFAQDAVFLDGASMGSGAHVRGGCLLEEQANGAHTVGLKQTILFPFVTLGSLINFCDAMLTGGTSRSDHSEVGSSYIHFNFTPDGDKTTASLFGDVPRGVLLDQPPIFLGGQGGAVGPVRTGFGTVVGAGAVLRADVPDDGMLVLPEAPAGVNRPVETASYRKLAAVLAKNITYLGNLSALESWYRQVRRLFLTRLEYGDAILAGALDCLASARTERIKRLGRLIEKVRPDTPERQELVDNRAKLLATLTVADGPAPAHVIRKFGAASGDGMEYLDAIATLNDEERHDITAWLSAIVAEQHRTAAQTIPALSAQF